MRLIKHILHMLSSLDRKCKEYLITVSECYEGEQSRNVYILEIFVGYFKSLLKSGALLVDPLLQKLYTNCVYLYTKNPQEC